MGYQPPRSEVADLITDELGTAGRRGVHVGVVFEEIKDLRTNAVVGHEILTRPAFNVPPLLWYQQGRQLGRMAELEARAIELALRVLPQSKSLIAANFSLDVLDSKPVQQVLDELEKLERPAVIELSEHHHTDGRRLADTLESVRGRGLLIAVDDAGTGDSDAAFVRTVRPDIIKIDHTNTWALNYSAKQRQFVQGWIDIARELDCREVIVEGVSSELVAEAVIDLGEQNSLNLLGQGYWITRTTKIDLRETANAVPPATAFVASQHHAFGI